MVRQNQYQSNQRKQKSQGGGQLLMVLVAFATGYMSSSIIDINHLGSMFNQSLSQWGWKTNSTISQKMPNNPTTVAHQPKLEFYTVLAQKTEHKVPVGTDLQKMLKPAELPQAPPVLANKVEETKKIAPVEVAKAVNEATESNKSLVKKGQYVVQLASFRYYTQAEKFRAKLLLKGFDVKITSISRGSLQWYRVMLGPFNNQLEAQKAQHAYQTREHTSGMVKPADA